MMLITTLRSSGHVYKRFYSTAIGASVERQHLEYSELKSIQYQRDNLDIVKKCRADPFYYEMPAFSYIPQNSREKGFLWKMLMGPGLVAVPPILFYNKHTTELLTIMHLGKKLCGFDGIIHGGLIASIIDESLGGVTFPNLPAKMGFTAFMNINYKKPLISNQWVIARSKLDKVENRKAFATTSLESINGDVFAEADSLFISPKKE